MKALYGSCSSGLREGGETSQWNSRDFPGGAVVKNLPANAGDMGSIPGPGISHMLRSS